MEPVKYEGIFPKITGTEEETRSFTYFGLDKRPPANLALDEVSREVMAEISPLCGLLPGTKEYRKNGSRIYYDSKGIECATPECDTPSTHATYIAANAELLTQGLFRYITRRAKLRRQPMTAVLPRRVIDAIGNTWACHDSFFVSTPEYNETVKDECSPNAALWEGFLRSRNFITGAGLVTASGLQYSQKLSKENKFNSYGYSPSLLRVDLEHGQRLETRCNDINLKDWACIARIGGAGLLLAATQSGLASKLRGAKPYQFDEQHLFTNTLSLDEDLRLKPSGTIRYSVDTQRYTVATILDELTDIPPHYRRIGQEILSFCDDFDAVLDGTADFEVLAGRADWAEKLRIIRASIVKNSGRQTPTDARSQAIDQLYDRTVLHAWPTGKTERLDSFGQMLARRQGKITQGAIQKAMVSPPHTRASRRVAKALEFGSQVSQCSWHTLKYTQGEITYEYKVAM